MYMLTQREKVVRIPPSRLGDDVDEVVNELARESYEGKIEGDDSLTVMIQNIEPVGEGRIVHGDGAVYQSVKFDSLVFKPLVNEVVEGHVCEVLKFGAFVRFGPLDGLLHVSQVMDDRMDADEQNQRPPIPKSRFLLYLLILSYYYKPDHFLQELRITTFHRIVLYLLE